MESIRTIFAGAVLGLAGCAAAPMQYPTALEITGEEIQRYWTPKAPTIQTPLDRNDRMTRSGRRRPMAHSVTVTYVIDANGEVHDARVIDSEPEGASSQWAVAAVSAFSYEPTAANGARTPVRPTHTVTMENGTPAAD